MSTTDEKLTKFAQDLQAKVNKLQPPKHISDLRKEYWKAGARAALALVNEALKTMPIGETP